MEWIEPMEPVLQNEVAKGDEWIHQVKWDGIRGLSYIEGQKARIYTKRGRERTGFYPELSVLPQLTGSKSAILDGEIIILDENGKPSFYNSLVRERVNDIGKVRFYAGKYPVLYIVFDLILLDDKPLTRLPLSDRREILLNSLKPDKTVITTDNFPDGEKLLELMKQKGWEGIVSKKKKSLYLPGKTHREWVKTKLLKKLLAVVCGVGMKEGIPNSLVLGVNRGNGLEYIGKASIGLTQEHFRLLKEFMGKLGDKKKPFIENHPDFKNVTWFSPVLTCWASFLEWTNDGSLRHPKILGFSDLKPLEANGREYPQ